MLIDSIHEMLNSQLQRYRSRVFHIPCLQSHLVRARTWEIQELTTLSSTLTSPF